MTRQPIPLSGPIRPSASGAPDRLVVLCHGYGANGNDLIGLADSWQAILPSAEFIAPDAPHACPGAPGGRQWFDLQSMTSDVLLAGATDAAIDFDAYIDAELDRRGLSGDKLALTGFSQGAMLALHAGLRRNPPPAVIVGFSGVLVGANSLPTPPHPPAIMLIHGDADDRIPVAALHAAVQALGQAEIPVRWRAVPGLPHAIDPHSLAIAGQFIADAFSAPANPAMPPVAPL